MKILMILAGGAVGSLARYLISGLPYRFVDQIFPWGTLAVNLIGSFFIGLLWGVFEEQNLSPNFRSLVFVGFLGGFTTFSTYSLETLNFLRDGEYKLGLVNVLANNILGIGLAFVGFAVARSLLSK